MTLCLWALPLTPSTTSMYTISHKKQQNAKPTKKKKGKKKKHNDEDAPIEPRFRNERKLKFLGEDPMERMLKNFENYEGENSEEINTFHGSEDEEQKEVETGAIVISDDESEERKCKKKVKKKQKPKGLEEDIFAGIPEMQKFLHKRKKPKPELHKHGPLRENSKKSKADFVPARLMQPGKGPFKDLSFVMTGELDSISREELGEIIRMLGGQSVYNFTFKQQGNNCSECQDFIFSSRHRVGGRKGCGDVEKIQKGQENGHQDNR
eukprot:TRINITY_DN20776_c0_g1_i1.p2 TRINITY_DN20776_c0_g1~~TRINITY_DN20776_c0_g1_i1.p2  ORF type:complete len:265 (+),score=32.70 TRINITY_DN20776_c0_g1_i1:183-977(+)